MTHAADDTAKEVEGEVTGSRLTLVLSGVLPGDRARIQLGPGTLILGRAEDCDVRLEFAEVSRRHAEIGCDGAAWVLRDLDSTNGVYVDGRRVRSGTLRSGSVVRLGAWLGVVEQLARNEMQRWCGEIAPGLIGGSRLERALALLRSVARSSLPIVLVGSTGTGKERFASAVHHWSGRSGPLHTVNCAALPVGLAESELFGHERGAFTGAELKTRGHFRAAEGGTLFLDELQELPSTLQAKVLRAVELKQVTPLGESRSFTYDARIVAASQRPLPELVESGCLRRDLAMRLSGLTVAIADLEERKGDVPTLFDYFLTQHASGSVPVATGKFYELLCLYRWPGNVRELELLARRMLALHGHKTLSVNELPDEFASLIEAEDRTRLGFESRDEEDRHVLNTALERTGGNVKRAAELANVSRARAYRLLGKRVVSGEGTPE